MKRGGDRPACAPVGQTMSGRPNLVVAEGERPRSLRPRAPLACRLIALGKRGAVPLGLSRSSLQVARRNPYVGVGLLRTALARFLVLLACVLAATACNN